MKKRHLTPQEIIQQCNMIAREKRMAERTPWTVSGILCSYGIMRKEGFKGERISKLTERVEELEKNWSNGKLDLDVLREKVKEKSGLDFVPGTYSDNDIIWRKGTYQHWFDKTQIEAQNTMNVMMVRYMLFFFTALIERYKFGSVRLNRLHEYIAGMLPEYQKDYSIINEWKKTLYEEAGVVFESPVDPLTHTAGSIMT